MCFFQLNSDVSEVYSLIHQRNTLLESHKHLQGGYVSETGCVCASEHTHPGCMNAHMPGGLIVFNPGIVTVSSHFSTV